MANVETSRPGDLFELWSLADIERRGLVMVSGSNARGKARSCLLTAEQLSELQRGLASSSECFAIFDIQTVPSTWSNTQLSEGNLWAQMYDADGYQHLVECAQELALPGNSLWVIPSAQVQSDAAGISGKRPNARGEVPLRGAY